jgi:hypothetical protein
MSQKSSLPQPRPICLISADGGQDAYPRDGKVDLDVLQAMIDIKASSGSCGHWHVDSEPITFPPPFFPEPHGAMIAVDQGQQPG